MQFSIQGRGSEIGTGKLARGADSPRQYLITSYLAASSCVFRTWSSCSRSHTCLRALLCTIMDTFHFPSGQDFSTNGNQGMRFYHRRAIKCSSTGNRNQLCFKYSTQSTRGLVKARLLRDMCATTGSASEKKLLYTSGRHHSTTERVAVDSNSSYCKRLARKSAI